MPSKVGILARLFGRAHTAPVVTQLYANAIGQPLLVHPQMGEQIIGAYLRGAVDARPPALTIGELVPETKSAAGVVTPGRSVAIINVSGPLVNRYEGDICDPGPLSYQELRRVFDTAMTDSNIEAVIFRMESPGGMAGGLFDLADHVHANRGTKPIYAVLDDYAYSACFGLAAACDEIWITRTGGAGSVGVIAYHVDQSEFDARVGVKVTAIYSGAHKNDLSPHEPLSDDARTWLQERMDSMRQLFADTVAKYRGMELQAVLDTEAQVYQGEDAIAVGFADHLGTFHDLMAQLRAGPVEDVPNEGAQDESGEPDAISAAASALAELGAQIKTVAAATSPPAQAAAKTPTELDGEFSAAVVASALPPTLSVALIKRGRADQSPNDAIAYATKVRDLCFAAGIESVAADYVERNVDIETVRTQLLDAKATDGPEVITALPADKKSGGNTRLDTAGIYERRKQRQ